MVVFNPESRKPEVFQLLAAPFGATRSVYSFLRVINSIWYIGVVALHLTWCHFFDDFVVFCQAAQTNNTGQTVEMLFTLLGWKFAMDGDKAVSSGSSFAALRVEVNLQHAKFGFVEFSNTPTRKNELVSTIAAILEIGTMSIVEARMLRGRMQFKDGQIFGRLSRLCMRAIADHAFLKKHFKLDMATRKSLQRFSIF